MRITIIHGQNHMGSTYHIGKLLAEQFVNSDIRGFFLPKDLEHFCMGCYQYTILLGSSVYQGVWNSCSGHGMGTGF